jgi:hypothetical protein
MDVREWVRLPSRWIENGGLKALRWGAADIAGANNTAALMVLMAIAHHADDKSGLAKLTYDELCSMIGLSRAKIAGGLDVLEKINVISRAPEGRSTFHLTDYDPRGGWCKLPAKKLYGSGRIVAFDDFKLRSAAELHALKLFFLFAARRDRKTNMAHISHEKISEYSGIEGKRIKTAISFLAAIGLVHVEHMPNPFYGLSSAYRLVAVDSYVHMGTRGRTMNGMPFEDVDARRS